MELTYERAKQTRDNIETAMKKSSAKLQAYPRGAMGLTPDAIKFSKDYQHDLLAYRFWHLTLRRVNQSMNKFFKKEMREDRLNSRKGRLQLTQEGI